MKKRNDTKVIFKACNHQQPMLLPPSLDKLIGEDHPVHIVNKVPDEIGIVSLISKI